MHVKYAPGFLAILFFALILLMATRATGQAGVQSRITQPIDNTKLITLRGNLHPMAASQFDRGAAPASLPMDHMLLVLKRSGDQEAAL